jgi:biotin carboxyl carrier protein
VTFELEAGGGTRQVECRGGHVVLDGRRVDIDAVKAGHAWSLLIARRSYEVSLVQQGRNELIAHVNGRAITVRGGLQRFRSRKSQASGAAGGGAQRVLAPMAGRIARVLVKAGDAVTARQGLVVVEAMKMENELRAPRAGIVTDVRAAEGALVEANAVLVIIECAGS